MLKKILDYWIIWNNSWRQIWKIFNFKFKNFIWIYKIQENWFIVLYRILYSYCNDNNDDLFFLNNFVHPQKHEVLVESEKNVAHTGHNLEN